MVHFRPVARRRSGPTVRRSCGGPAFALGLLGLLLSAPAPAQTAGDGSEGPVVWLDVAETEALVRVRHYEGLPEEASQRIGPEGCARLVELLADADERRHHATILVALGRCGPEGGLEAIEAWVEGFEREAGEGEIDRARFRAWQVLPFALSALAEHDPRAVDALAARLEEGLAPAWRFRHYRGAKLQQLGRRAAANGLAETGRPAAARALDRAGRRASDPALREHLLEARARHRAAAAARRAALRGEGRR